VWDLPLDGYYLVQRVSPAGTVILETTGAWTCAGYDSDAGICMVWEATPYFVPEWEGEPFPFANKLYTFAVKACRSSGQCSVGWSNTVQWERGDEWLSCDPRNVPACVPA
jgi:hypothetical protein